MQPAKRLLIILLFGLAFGFLEATVVTYLRMALGRFAPYNLGDPPVLLDLGFLSFLKPGASPFPNKILLLVEILRELSTLAILCTLSLLAGTTTGQRIGAFIFSFSVWDLSYYAFLRILIGWPKGLLDLDIYFLLPVMSVGPVLTPVLLFSFLLFFGSSLFIRSSAEEEIIE